MITFQLLMFVDIHTARQYWEVSEHEAGNTKHILEIEHRLSRFCFQQNKVVCEEKGNCKKCIAVQIIAGIVVGHIDYHPKPILLIGIVENIENIKKILITLQNPYWWSKLSNISKKMKKSDDHPKPTLRIRIVKKEKKTPSIICTGICFQWKNVPTRQFNFLGKQLVFLRHISFAKLRRHISSEPSHPFWGSKTCNVWINHSSVAM